MPLSLSSISDTLANSADLKFEIRSVDSLIEYDSPFAYGAINADYLEFISEECRERTQLFQPNQEITLLFVSFSRDDASPHKLDELRDAVHESLHQKLVMLRHKMSALKREGLWSLFIGVLCLLVFALFTVVIVPALSDQHGRTLSFFKSVMEVLLWVSIWFPIEKLVFEEWPLRASVILHERLAFSMIELVFEPRGTSPLRSLTPPPTVPAPAAKKKTMTHFLPSSGSRGNTQSLLQQPKQVVQGTSSAMKPQPMSVSQGGGGDGAAARYTLYEDKL